MDHQWLDEYLQRHQLTAEACDYIRYRVTSGPSRRVGDRTISNVCSEYQSQKMQASVSTESRSGELAYAIHLDHDDDVVAFYEQPACIQIRITDKNNRKRRVYYTPDFLVLFHHGARVIEVKPLSKLRNFIKTRPLDWYSQDEQFIYRPAKESFDRIGLSHEVVSSDELGKVYTANLLLLLKISEISVPNIPIISSKAQEIVGGEYCLRLSTLAEHLHLTDMTPLLILINTGVLYTNLRSQLLTHPETCWVALTPEHLSLATEFENNFSDYEPREREASVTHVPSCREIHRALQRLDRVLAGEQSRSVRRYRSLIKEGESLGMSPLQSLIPKTYNSGNYLSPLPRIVLDFLRAHIQSRYAGVRRLSINAAYRDYKHAASKNHPSYSPVTRNTYTRYVTLADQTAIAHARGGTRARNAAAEPSPVNTRELKPTRPLECATCDHYLGDIRLIVAETDSKTYTFSPWITVLRDLRTRLLLAIWIDFSPPSRIACAMVLRLCLRAYGRLPEAIVVDRGAEFGSVYFSAFAAHCGIHIHRRPTSHPRYGSEAERFFEEFRTQRLVHELGNTVEHREARSTSSSHASENHAALDLNQFVKLTLDYSNWRASETVTAEHVSPILAHRRGLEKYPFSGIILPYDEAFSIASAVDSRHFKIDRRRGIHINTMHYWHPQLVNHAVTKKSVEVRIEPEDPNRIYVFFDGQWITCRSSGAPLNDLSDPIRRRATALRHSGIMAINEEIKSNNDLSLMQRIEDFSKVAGKAKAHPTSDSSLRNEESPKNSEVDLFDSTKERPLSQIPTSEW